MLLVLESRVNSGTPIGNFGLTYMPLARPELSWNESHDGRLPLTAILPFASSL